MIQLGIIIGYLALLILLGFFANRLFRGTASDFMLASNSIGSFLLLMSLFGTTMTAFAMVGATGKSYAVGVGVFGMLASASAILHSFCFLVIGVPIWSLGRRYGYVTQIQFFRDRLESDLIGVLLFPILILLMVSYLVLGVVGSGAVVHGVTIGAFENLGWFGESDHGVPPQLASATICLVVLIYVFFGGMRGTAWANALQTMVFLFLGLLMFYTIANAIGGTDSFLENLRISSQAVKKTHLSRELIPKPVFFSFLLIPLSVGMFPHIFQHWLTARHARTFKLPIVLHPILIMIIWLPCVMVGVWATSASSGIPAGTPQNEVLAKLIQIHGGPVLGGLLTAGILAAIMSSLDSQFLCLGTLFTQDIVLRHWGGDKWSDQKTVLVARMFVAVIVVLTFVLSLFPRAIFDLGVWSFSGFTGLFPLVFASIYWRRLTAAGAVASVLSTLLSWFVMFSWADYGLDKRFHFPSQPIELFGWTVIPPMMPVVTIFFCSSFALILVSLLTKRPSQATLAKFFRDA